MKIGLRTKIKFFRGFKRTRMLTSTWERILYFVTREAKKEEIPQTVTQINSRKHKGLIVYMRSSIRNFGT